uniref:Putative secreted protein n=1 Tax=Anopheles triannulatus TaxID=58253 RepID=A0A2M4B7N8_9DIPT
MCHPGCVLFPFLQSTAHARVWWHQRSPHQTAVFDPHLFGSRTRSSHQPLPCPAVFSNTTVSAHAQGRCCSSLFADCVTQLSQVRLPLAS